MRAAQPHVETIVRWMMMKIVECLDKTSAPKVKRGGESGHLVSDPLWNGKNHAWCH